MKCPKCGIEINPAVRYCDQCKIYLKVQNNLNKQNDPMGIMGGCVILLLSAIFGVAFAFRMFITTFFSGFSDGSGMSGMGTSYNIGTLLFFLLGLGFFILAIAMFSKSTKR